MGFKFDPEQVRRAMDTFKKKLGGHIKETCEVAVEYSKEQSPWKTGTNRKSISADFADAEGKVGTFAETGSAGGNEGMPAKGHMGFRIYTQSGYGGFLEVGTVKMSARPYISPGFERAVNGLVDKLEGSA